MFTLKTQKIKPKGPKTFVLVFGIFLTTDVSSTPMIDKASICKNTCKHQDDNPLKSKDNLTSKISKLRSDMIDS